MKLMSEYDQMEKQIITLYLVFYLAFHLLLDSCYITFVSDNITPVKHFNS